jgi:D-sedoheptulose 7-phosphate isomerase
VSENTDFLYPFIDGAEGAAGSLLEDLAASAVNKGAVSDALRVRTLDRERDAIDHVAAEVAERLGAGGRLFTFGNGGSSTDASALAALFAHPPYGPSAAARCLSDDTAIVTALANDIGFDLVFSRQLIAQADAGDVALGISTSGNSHNLLAAFDEAAARGLLTIGFAGYEGGDMSSSSSIATCFVVRSESVHRVQETQAALGYALWRAVQDLRT